MKSSKKVLALLLAAAMMVCAFAGCGDSTASTASSAASGEGSASVVSGDKVVTIGIYEPASGDNGAGGKQETLGAKYANEVCPTVEIGGETYQVKLKIVDNQSSNDKAVSAASELVNANCSVVLGSYGSGVSIAASDTFKNAGIPAIGVTCTNPQVTEGNSHYFRICFLDPFQGTVLAKYAQTSLNATKAYVLTKQGDDYSVGLGHYFVEAFGEDNVVEETFPDGTSDFSSYVTNAKNQGCDVIMAPTSTEAAALIIDQVASQGLDVPMLAGDTWDNSVILDAAKGKNVSISVTTFFDEGDTSPAAQEFVKGFKEWVNADSVRLSENNNSDVIVANSAMAYDAYFVALEAIKAAGSTDPVKVNEALWNVNYTGVTGAISFNEIGDANRNSAYIKEVNTTDGTWNFVAVQTAE